MNFLSNWPILNMHTISSPLRHLLLNPTLLGRHTLVHPRSLVTQAKPVQSLLHGKKCIITGASRGIGAAIAKRFAAEGASCILIGRNEDLLRNIKGSLEAESGREEQDQHHRAVVGDVGSDEFWRSMKRERNVDVLVNAAGLTHYSPLFITSDALIQEIVQTNLVGTMLACKVVGKNMMSSRNGCIINIASLLGLHGGRGSAAYAASKAGVLGFTRALAAEAGEKGLRVNAIVPGYITTDMTQGMTEEARSEALRAIPLRRFGDVDEIVHAAVFLATNQYANNCVLNLDGGLSAV